MASAVEREGQGGVGCTVRTMSHRTNVKVDSNYSTSHLIEFQQMLKTSLLVF